MARLKDKYVKDVIPALKAKLGIKNAMRVPRIEKIVLNMGLGGVEKDAMAKAVDDLGRITGQKPVLTKARKSISNFKIRAGVIVGAKVTLRGPRMYEFMDRFINAALPRIRDFRGLSPNGFDHHGNYNVGIKEQTIFPEVDPNNVTVTQGMDITFVTSTQTADEARELLRLLGMPFSKN